MSFVAEPYLDVADQVLTALTGGIARESHRFAPGANSYSFAIGGDKVAPDSVRVIGQAGGEFFSFHTARDFVIDRDAMLTFLADPADPLAPKAGATWPDEGTEFYVGYYPVDAGDAVLTDRNVGSLTRTLGEAFGRELAVLRKQLELIHRSGFVDTAEGNALDMVVALLGVTRKARDYAQGAIRFYRDVPAPADIFIPAGTRVSTALAVPAASTGGRSGPVSFVTTSDRTLARGQLSVEAPIRAEERGPRAVVDAHAVSLIDQTVLGISGALNDAATVFGAAGESDDELRRRARTVAERAGRATPRALTNAIAGIGEIRENDVKIVEELRLRPGVVRVYVAAPPELAVAVDQAIQSTRAAGIRVEHSLQQYLGDPTLAPSSHGSLRDDGVLDVDDGPDPADFLLALRADVTVFAEDPRVSGAEKQAIEQGVSAAITDYVEASAIGDTLIYNRISAAIMAVAGVNDAVLDITREIPPSGADVLLSGKRNLRIPEGMRATIAATSIRVTFAGAPLSFDFQVKVKPKGTTGAAEIRAEVRDRLAAFFAGDPTSVAASDLVAMLAASDVHEPIAPEDVSWTAEYEQAGLIIGASGDAAAVTEVPESSRAILRDVAVEVKA